MIININVIVEDLPMLRGILHNKGFHATVAVRAKTWEFLLSIPLNSVAIPKQVTNPLEVSPKSTHIAMLAFELLSHYSGDGTRV